MRFRESPYFEMLKPELARIQGPGDFPAHVARVVGFIARVPEAKGGFAYAPGKWTVAQVIGHFTDAHLVFLGRILFLARGEGAPLPGFDENKWVPAARHERLSVERIRDLYAQTSALTLSLLATLPEGALKIEGVANGVTLTGEDILVYMMAHESHHVDVLRERYLKG